MCRVEQTTFSIFFLNGAPHITTAFTEEPLSKDKEIRTPHLSFLQEQPLVCNLTTEIQTGN